jgi:N-acetylmuramoyl-L-alanine amidase
MTFITIHNTGNRSKGADVKSHAAYIKGEKATNGPVSWHYTMDEKNIYQHLPDNEDGFHAGDGNRKGIGIEICMNSDGDLQGATDMAAELTAYLCKEHNILVANVVQHNQWNKTKDCPQLLRSGSSYPWDVFINKVVALLGISSPARPPQTTKQYGTFSKARG